MAMDEAVPGRLVRWIGAADLDWDAVYAEQLPRVYNFFRYRLGDRADVEDLTAVTFEKAWRARDRYRRDLAGFTTWLMTIARNVAIDYFRASRPLVPLDNAAEVADAAATPEDAAVRRSNLARLSLLMAALPDRERELLAFKYGAGMTNREIARLTGLSESNVGTIVHRAVQGLRTEFDQQPTTSDQRGQR
jgi:RNA polymerase sigma-70 factor (ECF subfamily)